MSQTSAKNTTSRRRELAFKLLRVGNVFPSSGHLRKPIACFRLASYRRGQGQPGNFFSYIYDEANDVNRCREVPHRHDFYEVIWLTEGEGTVTCDLQTWRFEPGTLFFAAPGRLHRWESATPARGYALGFVEEFLQPVAGHRNLPSRLSYFHEIERPVITLPAERRAEMTALFAVLARESVQPHAGREDIVRAYTSIILAKARQGLESCPAKPRRGRPERPLSARFRQVVEENFPQVMKVSDYARLLQMSRSQLNAKVHAETGRTASDLIHERFLLEARRLLMHSTASVSEIAYELNFSDPSYFCRFFRKRTGVSPGDFRAQAGAAAGAGEAVG